MQGGGMSRFCPLLLIIAAIAPMACAGPSLQQRQQSANAALSTLRAGAFDEAGQEADLVLQKDRENPYGLLVRAITRFQKTMHQLYADGRTAVAGAMAGGFNHRFMRFSLNQAATDLALVETDLAQVSKHPELTLDLCLACWQRDWNHSGEIDRFDQRLFEIEQDSQGNKIDEGDPRRRPTFRFDHGDVYWARAFVGFQRAALQLLLAYKWTDIDKLLGDRKPDAIVFKIDDPSKVHQAKQLLLAALDFSDQARLAYQEETDDEREWLPNPRQKNHPLPLPVDAELYQTWQGVIQDLRQLVQGETGLSVEQLAQLGDHQWDTPPRGYIDIGGMLDNPKDIVLRTREVEELERHQKIESGLGAIFGDYYVTNKKPTQLITRLGRMKSEIDAGEESVERKLRYLFWIN